MFLIQQNVSLGSSPLPVALSASFNYQHCQTHECQQDGLFPEGGCSPEFCMCSNGIDILRLCPKGLFFNPANLKCDYAENIQGCNYHPTGSPTSPSTTKPATTSTTKTTTIDPTTTTHPPPPTTTKPTTTTWNGQCIKDSPEPNRVLPHQLPNNHDNSPSNCKQRCKDENFAFSGVQSSRQCWCGNDAPAEDLIVDQSECNYKCDGHQDMMCGGFWRMNVNYF